MGAVRVNIIVIGEKLLIAKSQCQHGEWLPWLKDNFGWSDRTARNFMQTADAFGKSETVSNLADLSIDARALYFLAAPSMPQEVRDKAWKASKVRQSGLGIGPGGESYCI